jgi:diketogulonate reductase-like aldo/keto reductase
VLYSDRDRASPLVIGLWRLSKNSPAAQGAGVVRDAISAGFTRFDTAPEYGAGAADQIVARLPNSERNSLRLTTKLTLAELNIPSVHDVAMTARRVRVPKLEALLLRASPGHTISLKAIGVLVGAQTEGLIDFGGFSNCTLA